MPMSVCNMSVYSYECMQYVIDGTWLRVMYQIYTENDIHNPEGL